MDPCHAWEDYLGILRRLIAKGDPASHPLAERAIKEYWEATLPGGWKSGLRLKQADVMVQARAVLGDRRSFAETMNAKIEKKLSE